MNRQLLDATFTSWLARCTAREVGLAELPGANPNMPYGVVYPINSPRGEGSWANPEEDRDVVYQVTCVGKSPEQVGWMSDKVNTVIIGRYEDGRLRYTTVGIAGGTVLWRLTDELGGIVKSGDRLFQVVDTYRIRVAS